VVIECKDQAVRHHWRVSLSPDARSSLDLLAIDITDLPDARAGSIGEMATLIASTMTIDEVAEATRSTGREVLSALGSRFHRIYYAT
jgi:alanine racemase